MGNFKNAVRDCKDALAVADWNNEKETDPVPLKALMRRGQAYAGLYKFQKAVADLDRCLELAPDNKGVQKARAEVLAGWEEAKREEAVARKASKLALASADGDTSDEEQGEQVEQAAPA